jgi:hypothetical protein
VIHVRISLFEESPDCIPCASDELVGNIVAGLKSDRSGQEIPIRQRLRRIDIDRRGNHDDSGRRERFDCAPRVRRIRLHCSRGKLRGESMRVYRGGAWRSYPGLGRSAQRSKLDIRFGHSLVGFRAARELEKARP